MIISEFLYKEGLEGRICLGKGDIQGFSGGFDLNLNHT